MEANFGKLRPRAKCHAEFEFEVSWDATGSGGALEHLSKVEALGPCGRRCSCGLRNIGPAKLVNYVSFRSARSGLRMEANFEKLRPRAKCHAEFEFKVS